MPYTGKLFNFHINAGCIGFIPWLIWDWELEFIALGWIVFACEIHYDALRDD